MVEHYLKRDGLSLIHVNEFVIQVLRMITECDS